MRAAPCHWLLGLGAVCAMACGGCERAKTEEATVTNGAKLRLVFKHQPMWGDPTILRDRLAAFERAHPEVVLATEVLPNASEVLHQYFLTALEAKSRDFDVFVTDVVWIPEFSHAGWIADVSDVFPPASLKQDFIEGAAQAVIVDGRTFAVPWYVDVGILYYRSDLVSAPPRTYDELVREARAARQKDPSLAGFVWQGRQYEGLVCNAFESIWGHGGEVSKGGLVELDTPAARAGLGFLRELITNGTSPRSVTSSTEEETRRAFQEGHAVFMRNWPYAYTELQKEGSPVRGKVGFTTLPTVSGAPGHGALGGWQLALNAQTPPEKRAIAIDLIRHLTSLEANVTFAIAYGRNPPRLAAYQDARLVHEAPFIAQLFPAVSRAWPRPVTPYYNMMSDVLQSEFSAVVSGVRPADVALPRAQKLIDRITR
ncbi:Maltose/maltodextrin ABC transporter, substrate binding periplasmic protein MalE [Labilithrix luteola]|uniref:Maltose/maltodextrin ABC transporter, substrate binding periplasmic protein MalE n=1 Tax=Labilithrix luteola TaxID=1391654 RepID=A0A0K1PYJ9_9BACT|nr:ABC transporter substrate-binding protein [Labilithrix luteola]AKU98610.1 Maltose/maltodextrin ABC transporter, substrate binding periplasmic protein MalE [Labilithrix luteola]